MYLAGVIRSAHQGRQRDSLRRRRVDRHGLQPQREGVQTGRRVAVSATDLRLSVCLYRRYLPEAQLRRLLREHDGHDGDWCFR